MAISVDYLHLGTTWPSAYVRVDHFYGGKREGRITPQMEGEPRLGADIEVFVDDSKNVLLYSFSVNVPLVVDETPYALIYAHLKTLPGFENSIDLLTNY